MNKLIEEIIKPILEANSNIKKIVGIYGGRFQPFGPHHYKTYKWLQKHCDDAYITTSAIKKPPRHPMNFKEKVRHMVKMGVPSSKIVQERTPYVAENVLKKYDSETTAVIYIFGEKDAGRLSGGKKKDGGAKYYQDYKKNKTDLKGYEEHGYFLTAPHISISVGGKEVSGTAMRELLGSSKIDDSDREKLFKKMFGYFDKGVFTMMTNKFKKIYKEEVNEGWLEKGSKKDRELKLKITKLYSKAFKHMPNSPTQLKIRKEIEKLRNQLSEGVDLPIEIGDTVLMGKFKNKKVVVKSIDWNEKGDLLINGKSAMRFRLVSEDIAEFISTIDINTIIAEGSSSGGVGADSGPNFGFSTSLEYNNRGKIEAKKLGFKVINYLLDMDTNKDFRIYPDGPTTSVSYYPAGVGSGKTPNNQENLIGRQAYSKWVNHISNVATTVGMKLLQYLEPDDKELANKDSVNTLRKQRQLDREKALADNVIKRGWYRELLVEGKVELHEGVKFNNFLKDWSKQSNQPLEKINSSMNNKNTFSIAKLNDFSVDKVFSSAKSGFKTFQTVMNFVPDKISSALDKTRFGKSKDDTLNKIDGYLKKHPKLKRVMGVAAGAAITYAWTKMTFVGDPEYDLDLSSAASAAAFGDYTMSDLFSGELGTKFLILTAIGAGTGLTMPYTKVLGTVGTFTAGISFGAYRAYKKRKADKESADTKGLPDTVKNPNPSGRKKEVNLQSAVSWIAANRGNKAAKKFVKKLRTKKIKESVFSKDWWKKELLTEGGAYGHMAHPFDDKDLTFGDLKKIIENGLGGTLNREEGVTEKMDGQNLMVSWKNGKLLIARNKGHIKNFGKTALDVNGIKSKFEGRGDIADAFNFAVLDMQKGIKGLSQKQKDKIFNEGQYWMNLEVMWPKSANVIDYDVTQIIFHGALKYDESGNVIGEVTGSGRILAGMIKQTNQHIQKNYTLGPPHFLKVPKHQDFGKMKKKYLSKLTKLKSQFGLKDSDTLSLYHQKWWETFIRKQKKNVSDKVLKGLTKRWAFFDKSYKIPTIKKDITDEKFLEWVLNFDKQNHATQVKTNMRPFEVLFFEVGAEIMKNVSGFIAANPDNAVQGIKKRIDKAITDVKSGGDLKKLNRLKVQLDRLNAIGGLDSIVPSEGIVFKYKGNTYKFTGAFASVNQIVGLMTF